MKGNISGIKRALRSRLLTKSKTNSQTQKERDLLTGYDREYDPKMGHFYTCPACYRRYVSSEDVEEHLNTCSMQFMPEEKSSATPTILSVSSLSKASTLSQASSSEDRGDLASLLVRMLNDNDTKVVRSDQEEGSGQNGQDSGFVNAGDSRQIHAQDSGLMNGQDSGLIDADEILGVQSNASDQLVADTEHLMPFAFQQYFNNHLEEHQADQQQIQSHSISVIPEARINQAGSLCSSNQTLYQLNGRRSDEEDMDFDDRDPNIESSYGGFNCPTCDGYFETIEGLQSHVTICIAAPAAIPHQPVPSQPQLTSLPPSTPVMTYFETTGWTQMFPCIPCRKAFKSTQELSAHNMSTHLPSDLKCGVCHKVFASKRALAHHSVVHSDDKPHQCPICPMAFKHRSTLKSHSMTHKETPAVKCTFPGCGLTFRSVYTLRRHRRAHRDGAPMIAHPEGSTVHPAGASNAHHPEGASKEPELGQASKPAAKKKPTRRPQRRRSESPDPPSPVEVITIE